MTFYKGLYRIKVRISADVMLTIQMNSWNELSVVFVGIGAPLIIFEVALQKLDTSKYLCNRASFQASFSVFITEVLYTDMPTADCLQTVQSTVRTTRKICVGCEWKFSAMRSRL